MSNVCHTHPAVVVKTWPHCKSTAPFIVFFSSSTPLPYLPTFMGLILVKGSVSKKTHHEATKTENPGASPTFKKTEFWFWVFQCPSWVWVEKTGWKKMDPTVAINLNGCFESRSCRNITTSWCSAHLNLPRWFRWELLHPADVEGMICWKRCFSLLERKNRCHGSFDGLRMV